MKSFLLLLLGAVTPLFLSCSSENDSEPVPPFEIDDIKVFDTSNDNSASDIQFSITPIADATLSEYRVAVVISQNELTVDAFLSLEASRYEVVSSLAAFPYRLKDGLPDSDGNPVTEGVPYKLQVLAVSSNIEQTATNTSQVFELAQTKLVRTLASGFSASGGIELDDDGNIYVADFGTGDVNGTTILKFSPNGSEGTTFADGLLGPTGGAFDSNGNLYWSSYSASRVHKISADGQVESFANLPGPVAIVIGDDGSLFVASCDGNNISKISPQGNVSTFATSTSFNCPNGLTVDPDGNFYTCNFEDGNIFKITATGQVSSFARIGSGSSVNMKYHGGYLYITGRNANIIYRVSISDATLENFAGTGQRGKFDAGLSDATFSLPNGIAISPDGKKIYINDVDPASGSNANGPNFNPNILRVIDLIN